MIAASPDGSDEPDEPTDRIGGRHAARERALGLLYEAEQKDVPVGLVVEQLPIAPTPFALELVRGVEEHADELDEVIRRHARNWRLERMPSLDRAILRLATYELIHRHDVPTAVVIDEAVELAKAYSTEESGRFVNGMLSRMAEDLRPPGPRGP